MRGCITLNQDCLSRSIYPLGDLLKTEVRQIAYDMGYEELSKKAESYEICFVPDNDYRGFLKRREPEATAKLAEGKFVGVGGEDLGQHDGYPFFTIGQRKGLGIATGEPMYVTDIQPETNTVVLGRKTDLDRSEMWVRRPNFQKIAALEGEMDAVTKIRYKDKGTASTISMEGDRVKVEFLAPVAGIAPGQSAVFYDGDDVIGGGFIDRKKPAS